MISDTIFALSSARGKSAISVYRASGGECLKIISRISKENNPVPRKLYRSTIQDHRNGEYIDDLMWVYFASPNSFTGEDSIEFYTHGSIAVGAALTDLILSFSNVRAAEPGEFTKRSVLNGKMDLTSAEGLMDLINSETKLQKRQALSQMRGIFYDKVEAWRKKVIKIISLTEAFIDFPDEDIPEEVLDDSEKIIEELKASFAKIMNDKRKGERMRNGIKLAIYGRPNVGKSSLINYLAQRDVSIVSDISGTTRDIIETHLDIGGYPIILSDTAGINEDSKDIIELEGIKRAKRAVDEADIKIFLQSAEYDKQEFCPDDNVINIINKIDIISASELDNLKTKNGISDKEFSGKYIAISIKESIGLENVLEKIIELSGSIAGGDEGEVLLTQERHRAAIGKALQALERVNLRSDLVLASEDLRMAGRSLASVIGKIDTEEVLGEIFSNFCIGK